MNQSPRNIIAPIPTTHKARSAVKNLAEKISEMVENERHCSLMASCIHYLLVELNNGSYDLIREKFPPLEDILAKRGYHDLSSSLSRNISLQPPLSPITRHKPRPSIGLTYWEFDADSALTRTDERDAAWMNILNSIYPEAAERNKRVDEINKAEHWKDWNLSHAQEQIEISFRFYEESYETLTPKSLQEKEKFARIEQLLTTFSFLYSVFPSKEDTRQIEKKAGDVLRKVLPKPQDYSTDIGDLFGQLIRSRLGLVHLSSLEGWGLLEEANRGKTLAGWEVGEWRDRERTYSACPIWLRGVGEGRDFYWIGSQILSVHVFPKGQSVQIDQEKRRGAFVNGTEGLPFLSRQGKELSFKKATFQGRLSWQGMPDGDGTLTYDGEKLTGAWREGNLN